MVDVGVNKMGESALTDVVRKLHPMYQSGYELGSNGREPPVGLNSVTRPIIEKREDPFDKFLSLNRKDPFRKDRSIETLEILMIHTINDRFSKKLRDESHIEIEVDHAKVSFREGYIDGLKQFMQSKRIDISSAGLFLGANVITADSGLEGFLRGIRLETPNITRRYNPAMDEDRILNKYKSTTCEESLFAKLQFDDLIIQQGYEIGFVVRVAREYGVVLNGLQIPTDNVSYQAFMQGLKGEVRHMPFEGLLRSGKEDFILNKTESHFKAEMKAYEVTIDQAYHAGLQVWLKSQGVQGVETWAIRHPEALSAFKVALSGQTIREYELIPLTEPISLIRDRDFGDNDLHLIKRESYYLIDNTRLFDEPREPTPAEVARTQGQIGYNLGKSARLSRREV